MKAPPRVRVSVREAGARRAARRSGDRDAEAVSAGSEGRSEGDDTAVLENDSTQGILKSGGKSQCTFFPAFALVILL